MRRSAICWRFWVAANGVEQSLRICGVIARLVWTSLRLVSLKILYIKKEEILLKYKSLALAAGLLLAPSLVFAQQDLPSLGCIIEPSIRIDVSSPVEGVLDKLRPKLGDKVKKGELLFSLKSGVEITSVELAKVRADFALRHYHRNEDLYKEDLISVHERDGFYTDYQVAQKELNQARAVLALRRVKSSIDGVVIDRFVEPGEFVTTAPVMALAELNTLKVEVVMPASSLGSVASGVVLQVYPAAPVGGQYPAKVFLVDPIIDAASGTYRIRASIDNRQAKLPAGIECKVSL